MIFAGERSQLRIVEWIGQAAHIEYEIGVERYPMLVAERLEQERHPRLVEFDDALDPCAQRIGIQVARIDAMRQAADVGEQVALMLDGFGDGPAGIAQRMAPRRFRKTPQQRT